MSVLRQCGRSTLSAFACPSLPGQPFADEPVHLPLDMATPRARSRASAGRMEPLAHAAATARGPEPPVARKRTGSSAVQVQQSGSSQEVQAEKQLGRIALRSAEAVDLASRLMDLAVAKLRRSRLRDVYEAKAVALTGRLGRAGDFGSDEQIADLARVWQDDAFAEAVQCLCGLSGLTRGRWNVATASDYPGQQPSTEACFSIHWEQ